MNEKDRVINMLESGKISAQDALRLLEALGVEDAEKVVEVASSSAVEKAALELASAAQTVGEAMVAEVENVVLELETQLPEMPTQPEPEATPASVIPNQGGYTYECQINRLEKLDISWISGHVDVRSYDGPTVRITEYGNHPLEERDRMDLSVRDSKISIRWKKDSFRSFLPSFLSKTLLVELPVAVAGNIEDFKCVAVSCGIDIWGLTGENFNLNSTSGAISVNSVKGEDITVNAVSGAIKAVDVSGETLKLVSVSGAVTAERFSAESLSANSTSGKLRIFGNAEDFKVKSVSGSVEIGVTACPESVSVNTVSGRITLTLPESVGFTAVYNSTSGSFKTDFPVSGKLGDKKGKAVYGNGAASYHFNTVSGGIEIARLS